ncbi:MAG TPA: metal-dependent phosphohydrolase [Micromonosporaceae bacterium]|nr:metal-dependent phosphohydrolase [Micromonosporaceae bacterium]
MARATVALTPAERMTLLARWRAALPAAASTSGVSASAAASAAADAAGADLLDRWSEPVRRYHTVDHLTFMLDVVDAAESFASADLSAVRLATWFHDAVYDPAALAAGANERASADLAATMLPRLAVNGDQTAEVVRLVLLTADHHVGPADPNGALLADADLAILGTEPDRYRHYTEQIRAEYAHVPDYAFRAGRLTVLANLLALDPIYHLAPHRDAWEARARANLRNELRELSVGPMP